MGIVIALCLLTGTLVLFNAARCSLRTKNRTAVLMALAACWNVFWYGLQHLGQTWGWIALASGLLMLLGSLILFSEGGMLKKSGMLKLNFSRTLKHGVTVLMAVFALLYIVTIVQLNLGYPILR